MEKQYSVSNLVTPVRQISEFTRNTKRTQNKTACSIHLFLRNWWAPPWRNTTSVRKLSCSGVTTVYCNTIDHKGHCDTIKWRNYGAMCFLLSGLTLYYQLGKCVNLTRNAKDRKCSIVGVGRVWRLPRSGKDGYHSRAADSHPFSSRLTQLGLFSGHTSFFSCRYKHPYLKL